MKAQFRLFATVLTILVLILFQMGGKLASAATPIESGETRSSTISTPSQLDTWEFDGTTGDRVLIAAVSTSGLLNTEIRLVDPDFVDEADTLPGGDLLDHILQKTGTYTIIIQDNGLNNTGNYNISLLNLTAGPLTSTADPDGGSITSGETQIGGIAVSDMDAYQFDGEAGDQLIITAVATSGLLNTEIRLFDCDFLEEANTLPSGDLLELTLQKTCTYTIIIQDNGLNSSGSYNISILNLTAGPLFSTSDPNGGSIVSGETLSGSIIASDMDAFQFYGEANDRILVTAVATSGLLNTEIRLFDPDYIEEDNTLPSGDFLDSTLQKTGIYTIVIQDVGLNNTGNYNSTLLNLSGAVSSPGDCDGGLIYPGDTLSGSIASSDMDVYQFFGEAGDRIIFTAVASGGLLNTEIRLIDPESVDEADTIPSGDELDHILLQNGLYSIIVHDNGFNNTGTYNITLVKFPDTLRTGIYTPLPEMTACAIPPGDLTLTWEPVPGATGYDLFFGSDSLEPLVQVCANVPNSECLVTNLQSDTVYYWQVMAQTSVQEIHGPVNWFQTEYEGDFDSDCDVDGSDLSIFAADFGRTDCSDDCEGDFDGDNDVDGSDLAKFAVNFGRASCQ